MDNYEKSIDKAFNAAEKVGKVGNRLYIGCAIVFSNLFLAAFCLWGVYAAYTSWQLETNGETTTGTVVDLDESSDGDGGCCVYSPVVEFTVKGRPYIFEGDNASDPPAYDVGEEVEVIYDPADPSNAQINKWSERWLMPVILIPAMLLTALILNFFMIRSFWRNEPISS